MALSGISSVNSYFTSLINNLMAIERQPLDRLTAEKATLQNTRNVFSAMSTRLSDLLTAVDDLATDSSTDYFDKRTSSISNVSLSNGTVLTASVTDSAVAGDYNVAVTQLALEHRVRSDQQTYADQDLNLSGTFIIGGAASRSVANASTVANTVTGFGTASLASGQKELGTDTYYVEIRDNSGTKQFRVVDGEGNAVTVDDASDTGTVTTSSWQDFSLVSASTFDTGRGLTITFGSSPTPGSKGSGAASVDYTAQGVSVTVSSTHSLDDIATLINNGTYAEGNGVTATVVDRQLVIAAENTGAAHTITAADSSGTVLQTLGVLDGAGAFKNSMQTARDATFTVNGISVTRSKNSDLTDVITGATLNLAADAGGQSATLTVSRDDSAITDKVNALVEQFNTLQSYLATQTAVTKNGDTFTRGALASDSTYVALRYALYNDLTDAASGLPAGAPTSLREIGVTLDDSLSATVDESALTAALAADRTGVEALIHAVADRLQTRLKGVTDSSTGIVEADLLQIDDRISDIDERVTDLNKSLADRQKALQTQYAHLQTQIGMMLSIQQQMSSFRVGFSSFG